MQGQETLLDLTSYNYSKLVSPITKNINTWSRSRPRTDPSKAGRTWSSNGGVAGILRLPYWQLRVQGLLKPELRQNIRGPPFLHGSIMEY